LDCIPVERILFGTDFPYGFNIPNHEGQSENVRSYDEIIEYYTEMLPSEIHRKILYGNAVDFLRKHGVDVHD